MNDLPSWKQYHPRPVVERRQCRCTLHQRPSSCSSNAPISASRDCAVDVQLWLVILPNNFDLPKYKCSACADTQRDVGEMLPVSAQLHVQAVFRWLYSGAVRCRTSFLRRPTHQGAKGVSPDSVYAHAYGSLVQLQIAGCTIWVRDHKLLPLIFRLLEVTPVGAVLACSSIRAALVWWA